VLICKTFGLNYQNQWDAVVVAMSQPLNLCTRVKPAGVCCAARVVSGAKITHLTKFCSRTGFSALAKYLSRPHSVPRLFVATAVNHPAAKNGRWKDTLHEV